MIWNWGNSISVCTEKAQHNFREVWVLPGKTERRETAYQSNKQNQHWSPSTFPGLCIVLINVLSNGDTNDNMIMEGMEFACKYIFSGTRLALFWELLVSLSLLSPHGAQTFWSCLSLLLIFTISLFSFLFYFPALPFLTNLLSIQRQGSALSVISTKKISPVRGRKWLGNIKKKESSSLLKLSVKAKRYRNTQVYHLEINV